MAIVTRRYVFTGPSDADLESAVSSTAASLGPASISVDVQFDNAVPGTQDALDEFMAEEWFTPEKNNPATETSLILRSPDGTLWTVQVNNIGVLVVSPA